MTERKRPERRQEMTKENIKQAIKEMIHDGELGFELHIGPSPLDDDPRTEVELRVLVDDKEVYSSAVYIYEPEENNIRKSG